MALSEQINGILAGFADMPGLAKSDKEMIRRKQQSLPALLQNISEAWNAYTEKSDSAPGDLRELYDALQSSDAGGGELASFEELTRALFAAASSAQNDKENLSPKELYRWGQELDALSPRVPGTAAMDETTDYLTEKLRSLGIETWTEPIDFRGVFFHEWSFDLISPATRSFVCFPQNNVAFGDAEAELVDAGRGREADYAGKDVRGKIVLVNWGAIWDHEGPCATRQRYELLHLYDIAYANGVAGMVGYFEDTPGNSLKIVEPGIKPTGGSNISGRSEIGPHHQFAVPAVGIGKEDAAVLRETLSGGTARAKLVIRGKRKVSTTQSVVGFLPGTSDKTIALAAHSCTAFEGAICDTVGVVGVLGLAKYYASLPLEKREKSLLFFFDSFHVWGNCCQTANQILKNHEALVPEIEAFLWLDHLSDGKADSERLLLTSDNTVLWPLATLAMAKRGIRPVALPLNRIWVMCASGPFERLGIPTLSMQSFGDEVLTTEDTWDKFDQDILHRDVSTHLDLTNALMKIETPRDEPGEPVGGCGSLFTSTELPAYPPGEQYVPEPSYPLYVGGAASPVKILSRKAEKEEFFLKEEKQNG
ncbi:hypothetical protein AGMMS49983_12340 [Clostridia bacterium]|nr:hypothetical protein AGMMS49983_12340 [Clostridia bacterium]